MFPIRSLTPQQAMGNALVAGFKIETGMRILSLQFSRDELWTLNHQTLKFPSMSLPHINELPKYCNVRTFKPRRFLLMILSIALKYRRANLLRQTRP